MTALDTPAQSSEHNDDPSLRSLLHAHIKKHPWGAFAFAGLILSIVIAILELRKMTTFGLSGTTLLRNLFYGVWTIGLLMLVTFSVRTHRVRDVLRSWLHGFFPVVGAVIVAGGVVTSIFESGNFRTAFLVPIIEESFKVLPLLLLIALAKRGKILEPSVTDFGIAGFAIGAGFGLHEDGLWVRDIAAGFDGSWWGRLFPNFLNDNPFVIAHPGWTALAGLGIGLCWHFRSARFAWALGLVPIAVATLDHISINYRGDAGPRLRSLVYEGRLSAWMLIAGFILALIVDINAKKRGSTGLPTRTARECLTRPWRAPGKLRIPLGVVLITQLRRLNAEAYRRVRRTNKDASVQHQTIQVLPVAVPSDAVTTF